MHIPRWGVLSLVLLAACSANQSDAATKTTTMAPSPAATAAPTAAASATTAPTPDLAAIGQSYEAAASAFATADCQAATIINSNPTTPSWKQAMTVMVPALKDSSTRIRALGAPPDIQATLNKVAAALEQREIAAEAVLDATTDAAINDAIEQQYIPSVDLMGSAADAARIALGLPKRATDSCS